MNTRDRVCASAFAASVIAVGLGLPGAAAQSAGTHQVLVSAVIVSKSDCSFNTKGGSTISLSIDPAATGNLTASGSITIRCKGSRTASFSVSNNNGLYGSSPATLRMRHATLTTEHLGYAMSYPPSGMTPKDTDTRFTVTVSVSPADFQNMVPGSYSDTVILTITP